MNVVRLLYVHAVVFSLIHVQSVLYLQIVGHDVTFVTIFLAAGSLGSIFNRWYFHIRRSVQYRWTARMRNSLKFLNFLNKLEFFFFFFMKIRFPNHIICKRIINRYFFFSFVITNKYFTMFIKNYDLILQ